ncbi:MFS transporter [Pontiella sulfatireligans]|uniref:L-fucose-proton symporter n=1 Tax=Pontiella sulfatireligans TaxID=2750658 RepID=A0A6C2UTZ2_9BACT|nr:MFS transporter [Pontiella sulfatireligans]VGO22677.1 L-fucose-proton symporter [Pontiella sulfatireligans]
MSNKTNYTVPLASMSFLLFFVGFLTWFNNILVPFMKDHFDITDSQSNLVSAASFGAYALSIPVGWMIKKIGYKRTVISGSFFCGVGCMLFLPAVTHSFEMVTIALFITALGLVQLLVSANPYVLACGSPETSSSRLTFALAMNSVAASLAPFVGSFVLGARNGDLAHDANLVRVPFMVMGVVGLVMGILICLLKLPEIHDDEVVNESGKVRSVWSYPHLILGFITIGVYMGLEVGPGNFFVKYVENNVQGVDVAGALKLFALYPVCFFIGRMLGSGILRKFTPHKVLAVNCVIGIVLVAAFFMLKGSPLSIWPIIAQGLVLSIMWSVIFDLGLKDVPASVAKLGSGILCTGVLFTGFWMWLMGRVVESTATVDSPPDYSVAYYFLFAYYAWVIFYALKGAHIRVSEPGK